MNRFSRLVSLTVTGGILLSGCGFYHEKKRENFSLTEGNSEDISFTHVNALIIKPKCLQCHNSGNPSDGVLLDSYQNLKLFAADVEKVTLTTKTMPKNGSLTDLERSLLEKWFLAGMPEFASPSTEPAPSPVPSPEPSLPLPIPSVTPTPLPTPTESPQAPVVVDPTFNSIRSVIFEKKCTSCHNVGSSAEKVPLTNFNDLINSPRELVLPGDPDESGLVLVVERTDRKMMPPPSSGQLPLTGVEKRAIRKWILDGANNN